MIRYTTPTLKFKTAFAANDISNASITVKQKYKKIEKALSDCSVSDNYISVNLTQEDTGTLDANRETYVQLRVRTSDGKAFASQLFPISVEDVLKEGII